jgi:SAM-dependent methyltransferase
MIKRNGLIIILLLIELMAVSNCVKSDQMFEFESQAMPSSVLIRSSIARSIYERMLREDQLKQFDKTKWYKSTVSELPQELAINFIEMSLDSETQQFLDICYSKSDSYFTHLFHSIARTILCLFMSSTSANGLLGRGSMFIFSDQQFSKLMGEYLVKSDSYSTNDEKILLDLGAGDGKVTQVMAQYFTKTYATEISPVMKKILSKKDFNVIDINEWHQNGISYDLICCLNLLDRCDKPLTMLRQMKASLKHKTGLILLALVLPFSQYVEVNDKRSDHKPSEVLSIGGNDFESQLVSFRDKVLTPNGLEIIRWTKLPYLCEGDIDLTYYWLNDVVILLKPTHDS